MCRLIFLALLVAVPLLALGLNQRRRAGVGGLLGTAIPRYGYSFYRPRYAYAGFGWRGWGWRRGWRRW